MAPIVNFEPIALDVVGSNHAIVPDSDTPMWVVREGAEVTLGVVTHLI